MNEGQARKAAGRLVKKLGRGWKPNVWASGGCWHYNATALDGRWKIQPSFGEFKSSISLEPALGVDASLHDGFTHRDPQKVVQHQMEVLQAYICKYAELVHDIHMGVG